ncbi:MAG: hypothetical protein HC836_48635 [Richelia sp. RM2_1_2]|nr:hypothetical protein [Richelia sp. RM2_1_2]
MFANGIFSILDEWFDLDHNLEEDNADNFTAIAIRLHLRSPTAKDFEGE